MYTVALEGERNDNRRVTLVFSTGGGETTNNGMTDDSGVVSMWGPWSTSVRVSIDGQPAVAVPEWQERPADRFTRLRVTS